jgi:very-short-patch-repair endonuclease
MADARQKLIGLLDYVEQVVRLDERVAFRLSEYRLPDNTTFAVAGSDTQNLPGVRHDHRDDEGPVWLEVERLVRKEPPPPPDDIGEWVVVPADPAKSPDIRSERLVTVTAAERDAALASGSVRPDDVLETPRKRDERADAPPRYDLKFRLEDHPEITEAIKLWVSGPWTEWSTSELPRRKTIALYQGLYKIFQLLEVGGTESPIELAWGIGVVNWQKEGRLIDRPLLERRVDIELDDKRGGLIRVRPTGADALFDLKPYEALGCANLLSLADLTRREIQRAGENEGISPFVRESFEPILSQAGVRLDPEGCYAPDTATAASEPPSASRLMVTDKWVLFARPRSQHVVLQDIDRLRRFAGDEERSMNGLPQRLVTEPSREAPEGAWEPLSTRIGGSGSGGGEVPLPADDTLDVFFPKPFNDDQLEIIRRLSKADGLVVQGPPGTGKTHTIANLICHAMATGERVLVVSRGEAALAVLKEQLPTEVQPLAVLTARPDMQERTIGVISLVGAEQAEHIRARLSEKIGEELMQRHSILCGDSATFQGSERDIVYLSMVADSANKTALTMLRYEQRFNVAVSRARDRVVLVRSVKREELNPNDLKARLIAHFENPMPELEEIEDALSVCESKFERDLMQRLLERGYRVRGQVGSIGYRIDMVVEGADRRRLAVECDGDRYHGPEQWRHDMRRQRVLERVGWRFWRCFASSFYREPAGVVNDLVEMLTRMGIQPISKDEAVRPQRRFTEHRIVEPVSPQTRPQRDVAGIDLSGMDVEDSQVSASAPGGITLGDKVVLVFADDQKRVSVRISNGANDLEKGRLSPSSPLGKAILGAEEGDEVELSLENGRQRKVLIESVEKGASGSVSAAAVNGLTSAAAVS